MVEGVLKVLFLAAIGSLTDWLAAIEHTEIFMLLKYRLSCGCGHLIT